MIGYAEGDTCGREGCVGVIATHPSENCSCHISAPCFSCTSPRNFCPSCDWQEADDVDVERVNDFIVKVDKASGVYKSWTPRPLDPSKIDWHSKSHSSSSMIKEGVYPPDVTRADVEKVVRGTFGGRFEHFGAGRFKYIAYTD